MVTGRKACSRFLADFTDFIDGTLPPRRLAEMHAHLDCCERCLTHLRAYRRGIALIRSVEPEPVEPDDFYAELTDRIWSEVVADAVERPAPRSERVRRFAVPALEIGLAAGLGALLFFTVPPATFTPEAGEPAVSFAGVVPRAVPTRPRPEPATPIPTARRTAVAQAEVDVDEWDIAEVGRVPARLVHAAVLQHRAWVRTAGLEPVPTVVPVPGTGAGEPILLESGISLP